MMRLPAMDAIRFHPYSARKTGFCADRHVEAEFRDRSVETKRGKRGLSGQAYGSRALGQALGSGEKRKV